ncbi:MAG TPA: sigma-70 family RNA polymerase sigma factor [Acidimicrobiales bacterium]|nr:sigma-70 family RNA polymerase sigma factor [Acidimicrobiales bacterium]
MSLEEAPGAETGLAALHRDHYRSLVRLAAVLVDDVATCEELVQDAFVAVLARRSAVGDAARLPAYLRSAVLNRARSHLRRRRTSERPRPLALVRTEPSAEAGALLDEEHQEVLAALRALPERQREVLALRYYIDLSEADIAATLGIGAGTVKTHAQRGLAALHQTLGERR